MLARCTACRNTFATETFGRQSCPACGAEVEVRAPPPASAPEAEPGTAPSQPPPEASAGDGLVPWERREALGFWNALFQTLKGSLFEPGRFFRSMRYDKAPDALLYFACVAIAPPLIARLLEQFGGGDADDARTLIDALRPLGTLDEARLERLESLLSSSRSSGAALGSLVAVPVVALLQLHLFAGISHLVLMALGKDRGGWIATRKAFIYAASPLVFQLVPGCGGLIALSWASALQMIALARAHETSVAVGAAAVIGWHLVALCCACLALMGFVGMAALTPFGG